VKHIGITSVISTAFRLVRPAALRLAWRFCPLCERNRLLVRLDENEIAIRCCACRASAVSMSIAAVIGQQIIDSASLSVFELSARGPLLGYLKRKFREVTCSEYFPGIPSGMMHDGILCQDVQALSFADHSFDLCTSTDVFEHVPDDLAGFSGICRVLRPGGVFIFTVPLIEEPTVERAAVDANGVIHHMLPPEYHGDPVGESGQILAFRNYGPDICTRLQNAGFSTACIVRPPIPSFWGISRDVIVARR
jgi:SAM-dependent methyltransferase